MSVPGAIAPVEIEGALYVDGGLLQNIPVAAAREACADVVIAVNVGSGLLKRNELGSILRHLAADDQRADGAERALLARLDAARRRADRAFARPSTASMDFEGSIKLVAVGEAAARAQADGLRPLLRQRGRVPAPGARRSRRACR